ncbi:MAG: HAD hydrolase family protein [Planctomycetota bacterium]
MPDVELLLTDVDGVLTDGSLTFDSAGVETKTFNVRDGLGVRLWQRAGGKLGIVTGRASTVVERRADELDIAIVCQAVGDKGRVVRDLAEEHGVPLERIAFLGDDLPDLPAMRAVGLGVAVADAAHELLAEADHVTAARGGRGALRELVERLLRASGRWDAVTGALHG